MCGIAGSFNFKSKASPLDLQCLNHRGPDDSGQWTSHDGKCWLGQTRLSILDLSPTGHQPMTDPETGNTIIFNGEIYNHLELRRQLEPLGCVFHGTSDTETLLMAYRIWRESCLPRLKGMFAFAIYEPSSLSLWLARDRFGIKPLYYHHSTSEFLFASEVKALATTIPAFPTDKSIAAYLQFGACLHEHLIFPEIREFPTANHMRIYPDGSHSGRAYWKIHETASPRTLGKEKPHESIRRLLTKSVEEHLLSDVPVASLLSGGVDSSIITALAARASGKPIETFSVGFPDSNLNESPYAELLARRYGCNHHHIELSEDEVLASVEEAMIKMDLPSVDAINTYIVAKRISKEGFKVALSGLGGDELFGGYPQFRLIPYYKYLALAPEFLKKTLLASGKGKHLLRDIPFHSESAHFALWWRRIWSSSMLEDFGLPHQPLPEPALPQSLDEFSRISWAEIHYYMRDTLLRDTDQMTMALSLELRVPFLDHEFAQYVFNLPEIFKKDGPWPKSLLIESFADLLPREIYDRPKMGFELPMDKWLRGPLKNTIEEGLDFLTQTAYFKPEPVRKLKLQFESHKLHWSKIWAPAVLGHYLARHEKLQRPLKESSSKKGSSFKKISMVTTDFLPNIGGVAQHIFELARALSLRGYEVEVIAPYFQSEWSALSAPAYAENIGDLRIWRIPFCLNRSIRFLSGQVSGRLSKKKFNQEFIRRLKQTKPDIIHWHAIDTSGNPLEECGFAPRVWTNHTSNFIDDMATPSGRHKNFLEAAEADQIIAPSEELVDLTVSLGIAKEKVHFLSNGVDSQRFHPGADANFWKAKLNLKDSHILILCPRRLEKKNGVRYFIEAATIVLADPRFQHVHFAVAGNYNGPKKDSDEEIVDQLVARSSLPGNFHLLGRVENNNIPGLYSLSAFVTMPSLIEATSLSAMEGMACAKAILSTNVGGLPFLVIHEINGLLVPPADSRALADGMKRLLLDPELTRRLGQNSRKRVEEDLDWSAVAQKTEQIYRLACLKHSSSSSVAS